MSTQFRGKPGYSREHFKRLAGYPDPVGREAELAAERIRRREIGEQAYREMMERFSPLTPDNAGEAIRWQEARIKELCAGE